VDASRAEETPFGSSFAHRFLCDRSWRFPVFNFFFLSYMICPRFCHRLVGYLEEEAVATYVGRYAKIPPARLQAPLAHALNLCAKIPNLLFFCAHLQPIQCSLCLLFDSAYFAIIRDRELEWLGFQIWLPCFRKRLLQLEEGKNSI